MRVLAVGSMYPPHHLGGYELVWREAMDHLRDRGNAVRVLCSDLRLGSAAPDPPHVHRELRWYWRDHAFPRRTLRERVAIERHNAAVLDRHVRELRPDVVCWWAMGGMSMGLVGRARRCGVPSAAFVMDDWPLYGPLVDAWSRAAGRRLSGAALARAAGLPRGLDVGAIDAWAFISATVRDRVERRHGELPGATLLAPGVDLDRFRPAGERTWRWRLLYAGRIDRRKGIDTAVEALARLPEEATLEVSGAGDPSERRALGDLVDRLGLRERVTFSGGPDREAVARAYAAADVLLFPVRWEEPWGLVPLEAMATGLPVVASGRGGSGEYMRDGENVLLAGAGDPDAVADAVRRLADDPPLRARLRAAGRATAEQHDQRRFLERMEALLERLAAPNVPDRAL